MRRVLKRYNTLYKRGVDRSKRVSLPFFGGLPLYWVIVFFIRNLFKESINLRASSIAFNLFLAIFPALIFLFTLLPYIPIDNLHKQVLYMLQSLMPASAYETIDSTVSDILSKPRGGLLSFGLGMALYFASNGIFSLMEAFNKRDKRSAWRKRSIAIGLTLAVGLLLITVVSLFLLTEFSIQLLIYYTTINHEILYYMLVIARWITVFILLFGMCVLLFRLGDNRTEKWKYTLPGAILACLLMVATSIGFAYYVENFANYNRLYGSLGALIITMLWMYFNAMVLIIGHEFNRSLQHAKLVKGREGYFN